MPRANISEATLKLIGSLFCPVIYGSTVTMSLAVYYVVFKIGDITVLPRMLKFVSMQFTPWFILSYAVMRLVIPDLSVRRTENLLLPVLEALAAVLLMAGFLELFAFARPTWNTVLYAVELLVSVVLARIWVRRTFRH